MVVTSDNRNPTPVFPPDTPPTAVARSRRIRAHPTARHCTQTGGSAIRRARQTLGNRLHRRFRTGRSCDEAEEIMATSDDGDPTPGPAPDALAMDAAQEGTGEPGDPLPEPVWASGLPATLMGPLE